MIIKIENKSPKITFMTLKGNRTPKIIWIDEEMGVRGITKKEVETHVGRLNRMGITSYMTDQESIEQAKKYIESVKTN